MQFKDLFSSLFRAPFRNGLRCDDSGFHNPCTFGIEPIVVRLFTMSLRLDGVAQLLATRAADCPGMAGRPERFRTLFIIATVSGNSRLCGNRNEIQVLLPAPVIGCRRSIPYTLAHGIFISSNSFHA